MREHVRPDDRRRHAAVPRKRPTEPAPADSILALKESELDVTMVDNPLASKLHEAAAKGKHFPSVFLSTWTMMSKMADVYVSNFQPPTANGGEQSIMVLSLNFKEVVHELVKK